MGQAGWNCCSCSHKPLSELISGNFGCFGRGWDRKLKLGVKFRWETLIFWCLVFPVWKQKEKSYLKMHTLLTEIWDRSCSASILLSIFEGFSCRLQVKLWNKCHFELKNNPEQTPKNPTLITDLFQNLRRHLKNFWLFTLKCGIWIGPRCQGIIMEWLGWEGAQSSVPHPATGTAFHCPRFFPQIIIPSGHSYLSPSANGERGTWNLWAFSHKCWKGTSYNRGKWNALSGVWTQAL